MISLMPGLEQYGTEFGTIAFATPLTTASNGRWQLSRQPKRCGSLCLTRAVAVCAQRRPWQPSRRSKRSKQRNRRCRPSKARTRPGHSASASTSRSRRSVRRPRKGPHRLRKRVLPPIGSNVKLADACGCAGAGSSREPAGLSIQNTKAWRNATVCTICCVLPRAPAVPTDATATGPKKLCLQNEQAN